MRVGPTAQPVHTLPDQPDLLYTQALVYVRQRDYAKAALLLRQALEIKHEPRVERFLARVEEAIRRT